MAILKIRDENGNVQEILVIKGEKGEDYVLTEADKQEIAAIVSGNSAFVAELTERVDELESKPQLADISSVDTWYGEVVGLHCTDGIQWRDEFAFLSATDAEWSVGTILHRIPLVQGENVTFGVRDDRVYISVPTEGIAQAVVNALPTEAWTFTLEDGSTVTKTVVLK
jgi:hypothetical protein